MKKRNRPHTSRFNTVGYLTLSYASTRDKTIPQSNTMLNVFS